MTKKKDRRLSSVVNLYPPPINSPSQLYLGANKKEHPMLRIDFSKFPENHQPNYMLYDLETSRKSYLVVVDKVTLKDGRRVRMEGLKFFEFTRNLEIKGI